MQRDNSTPIVAILASAGIHALLLLIPWQPTPAVELVPLEGSGVVELAVLQQVRGNSEAEVEKDLAPEEELSPKEEVTQAVVQKPQETKPSTDASRQSDKPVVSIKQVQEVPQGSSQGGVLTSPQGSAVIPAEEDGQATSTKVTEAASSQVQNTPVIAEEPKPALPAYPGNDPTGEAMVASKRVVVYPKESQSSNSEGKVIIEVRLDPEGKITSTEVLSGPEDEYLKRNAELTIQKYWTFKKAEKAYKVVIEVTFTMQGEAKTEQRFISASFLD